MKPDDKTVIALDDLRAAPRAAVERILAGQADEVTSAEWDEHAQDIALQAMYAASDGNDLESLELYARAADVAIRAMRTAPEGSEAWWALAASAVGLLYRSRNFRGMRSLTDRLLSWPERVLSGPVNWGRIGEYQVAADRIKGLGIPASPDLNDLRRRARDFAWMTLAEIDVVLADVREQAREAKDVVKRLDMCEVLDRLEWARGRRAIPRGKRAWMPLPGRSSQPRPLTCYIYVDEKAGWYAELHDHDNRWSWECPLDLSADASPTAGDILGLLFATDRPPKEGDIVRFDGRAAEAALGSGVSWVAQVVLGPGVVRGETKITADHVRLWTPKPDEVRGLEKQVRLLEARVGDLLRELEGYKNPGAGRPRSGSAS